MLLSDKIKKFSVEQAIDYLNRNPVKNLPKLLDWADTFCAGKLEGQRRAIRKACLDPADAQYVGGCIAGGRRALDRPHEPRVCRAPVQQVRQLCRLLGTGGGKALARQPGRGEVPRQAGSRRGEKEVKRAQRMQKNCVQRTQKHRLPVGRRCFFQPSPRGEGQGTQSRTGKSVISAAGAAPRDSKTKKRAWKGPSMHVSGQMGFPRLGLAAGQLCWPWAG